MIKIKKRRKVSRMHGRKMGTHGWGARKKHKKSGHSGGKGMSGSGKRADHKKTLITKIYGSGYFGKKGFTSIGSKKDKRNRINIGDIEKNIKTLTEKGLAKKSGEAFEVELKNYKILSGGEVKTKLFIKAKEASKSAIEKIKKAGGDIIFEKSKKSN